MKTILEALSEVLAKKRDPKNIILSIIALIISIVAIYVATTIIEDTTSVAYLTVMTIGIVGCGIFSIKLIIGGRMLVYQPTNSPIDLYSIFFNTEELNNLSRAIEVGNTAYIKKNKSENNNAGIRLDIAVTRDQKFAACQICKYIPYNYEPVTDVILIPESNCAAFTNLQQ